MLATKALPYEEMNDPGLDVLVAEAMGEFHTPGVAVLVVDGTRTFAKGYGVSDLAQGVPTTPRTLFFTASTTKSFTSAIAAHVVASEDHPSISWQTPIAEILGENFRLDHQYASHRVTILDALCHRTGSPRHDLAWTNGNRSNLEIVRSLRHLPLHEEPRTEWEYSNNPYTAVACAMEVHLNRPFKNLLQEQIFEPLNMETTTYDLKDALKIAEHAEDVKMSRAYFWDKKTKSYEEVPWVDVPPPRGAGGIISNVADYAHWVRHLMNPTDRSLALSHNAVRAMRTPQMIVKEDLGRPHTGPIAYGLGLFTFVYQGREILLHSGAIPGYMSIMLMVPPTLADIRAGKADSGWAVVTMQNSFSLAQDVVVWHLLDEHLGTPDNQRFNMAQKARDQQAEAEAAMQPDAVVKRLYGMSVQDAFLVPALPLECYQGIYQHAGYGDFRVSLKAGQPDHSSSPPSLYMESAEHGYCAVSFTLYHVSGEWWWAEKRFGPGDWLTTTAHKIEFAIGVDGTVSGMRFQAESSMPDFLAFCHRAEEL